MCQKIRKDIISEGEKEYNVREKELEMTERGITCDIERTTG